MNILHVILLYDVFDTILSNKRSRELSEHLEAGADRAILCYRETNSKAPDKRAPNIVWSLCSKCIYKIDVYSYSRLPYYFIEIYK